MSLRGWNSKDIKNLRGAWTRLDQIEARPDRAFEAKNVRIEPGRVRTRDGNSTALAVSGKVTSMHQWISSALNRLIFYEGSKVRMQNLGSGSPFDLFTLAGRAAWVAEAGDKAYISVFTTAGVGAGEARITYPLIGGTPSDKAFSKPYATSIVVADGGAGNCTEGAHRFAYIIESRSGFVGQPSPIITAAFAPTSYTVAAGGRSVTATLTATFASDAAFIHILMTRVDNPDKWYFVPGGSNAVPPDAVAWPVAVTVSVSDEDLALSAESADDHFNYLVQSSAGTGPFSPSVIIPYNNRLAYIVDSKVYISDPYAFEALTEDQHAIQMPGKRRIVTGFPLRGSLYLLGPGWTHAMSDNGDVPRLWSPPESVSEAIGTNAPFGVEWRTAGDYAWVATEFGLYLFAGRYEEKPISYLQSDWWGRINWAAAYAVQVRDNVKAQRVEVSAPIDAATEPSHLLIWDYSRGLSPEAVDFSYDVLASGGFSSIAQVQDPTTGKIARWIGPSATGNILKEVAGVWSDNGTAIHSVYESGSVLAKGDAGLKINRFGGLDLDVTGAGDLTVTVNGKDDVLSADAQSVALDDTPGEDTQLLLDLVDENASVRLETNAVNEHFEVSQFRPYWRPYLSRS